METRGCIYNIQHFSIHDGPGIRTLVFFKGCRLRCPWCANPESQDFAPEIGRRSDRCVRCGACRRACPRGAISERAFFVNPGLCDGCGKCVDACPQDALVVFGKRMSAQEVITDVARDRSYYRISGGGVTVSGGEPFDQAGFLRSLLSECQAAGFHTAVETNGYAPSDVIRDVSRFVDLFLFDMKHMDRAAHEKLCGVPNQLILDNLRLIALETEKSVVVRIPVIPGMNNDSRNFHSLADMLSDLTWRGRAIEVHVLPYHGLGISKYQTLGREYLLKDIAPPSETELREVIALFRTKGICAVLGG